MLLIGLDMLQDFAVEPDEQRMRKAAHLMVGSLAGSLALVTCRDPLRTSLTNRLRSLLAQGLDAAMLEQYVQVCSLLHNQPGTFPTKMCLRLLCQRSIQVGSSTSMPHG